MGTFTERIRLIFDVDDINSKKGFVSFGKSVREAEGFTGKLKAGVGSLSSTLKQNMAPAALAAGAALVTFAVKAADAFSTLAKTSIDTGRAIGTTTEQASRWIAVADDAGVSAEQFATGVGKIAKTLDSGTWERYGIATRDATGNLRDTNDILIDALDLLSRTEGETARAKIGTELFGRSWANVAPLLGHTRAEYEKMLASVEDGQVITDSEAAKGEKWRLALDKLSDAFGEVTLAVGETVTQFAPMVERTAGLITKVNELSDSLGILDGVAKALELSNPVGMWGAAWDAATTSGKKFSDMTQDELIASVDKYVESEKDAIKAVEEWAAKNEPTADTLLAIYDALGLSAPAQEQNIVLLKEEAAAREEATKAAWADLDAKNALINSTLGAAGAERAYKDAIDDYIVAEDDRTTSKDESAEALDRAAAAALRNAEGQAELNKQQAEADGVTYDAEQATRDQIAALEGMSSLLAPGDPLRKRLEEYIALLREGIPAEVTTKVSVVTSGAGKGRGSGSWGVGTGRANGGPTTPGIANPVVERGMPELYQEGGQTYLLPAGPGQVTPLSPAGGGRGDTYNITVQTLKADADIGRVIQDALNALNRRGG